MKIQLLLPFLFSLLLTILLETLFFFLSGKKNRKDLLLLCLVNLLTNPLVVLFYWLALLFTNLNSVIVKMVLEFLAIAVEAYYYKNYGQEIERPWAFSISANAFSFSLGLLIQWFI
jgi:hypothetical protein